MTYAASYFTNSSDRFTTDGRVKDTSGGSDRANQPGRAISYSGTNQYTDLGSSGIVNGNNWTIAGWVKVDSLPASGQLATLFAQHESSEGLRIVVTSSGNLQVKVEKSGQSSLTITSADTIATGAWHFVAVNRSGSNPYTIKLYVNGLSATSGASSYTVPSKPCAVGARISGSDAFDFLDGEAWNWVFWNVALTDKEIAELYLRPIVLPQTSNLSRCYKFEDNSTLAYDCGPVGSDAPHQNGATPVIDASVPDSYANAYGYSMSGAVIVPRREDSGFTGVDAKDNAALSVTGKAPRHAKVNNVNAVQFSGTGSDYVQVGTETGAPTGTAKRTICFWVRPDDFATGATRPILQYCKVGGAGQRLLVYAETTTGADPKNSISVGFNSHRVIASNVDLSAGEWIHVAVVVPTVSGTLKTEHVKIFINGKNGNAATESGSSQNLSTSTVDIAFAADLPGPAYGKCALSNVYIYNEDFSSDEDGNGISATIQSIMHGELEPLSQSHLVVGWPLAEGSHNTNYAVKTSMNGTFVNTPIWTTGDNIPSYNLRFGHTKALHIASNNEFVETPIEFLLDRYTSWEFECEFKVLGTMQDYLTLIGMNGAANVGVFLNGVGKIDVCLGGVDHNSHAMINGGVSLSADTWHRVKIVFIGESYLLDATEGNLRVYPQIQLYEWTGSWTLRADHQFIDAPSTFVQGALRVGNDNTASNPLQGLIREAIWRYRPHGMTSGYQEDIVYATKNGYGTTLPDSGGKTELPGKLTGCRWHYIPTNTSNSAADDGTTTPTNGVGAFHNNAEAKLDFTGDALNEEYAPWLYDRVVPDASSPYAFGDKVGIVEKDASNQIHLVDFRATGADASRMRGLVSGWDNEDAMDHALLVMETAEESSLVLDERIWPVTQVKNFASPRNLLGFGAIVEARVTPPSSTAGIIAWRGLLYSSVSFKDMDSAAAGTNVVTSEDLVDAGIAVGDWVLLRCAVQIEGMVPHSTSLGQFSEELHKVTEVNTNTKTVTLRDNLVDSMTSGYASIGKLVVVDGVTVKGVTVTNGGSHTGHIFEFRSCVNVAISDIHMEDGAPGGIVIRNCADIIGNNIVIDGLQTPADGSHFGIYLIGGSNHCEFYDYSCQKASHTVTTSGNTYAANAPLWKSTDRWGTPTNALFKRGIHRQAAASYAYSPHAEGFDFRMEDSHIFSDAAANIGGSLLRTRNSSFTNVHFHGYEGNTVGGAKGVDIWAGGCSVTDCVFDHHSSAGILLLYDHGGIELTGNVYRYNGLFGIQMRGTGRTINGDWFIANGGFDGSNRMAIRVSDSTEADVANCVFWYLSGAQHFTIQRFEGAVDNVNKISFEDNVAIAFYSEGTLDNGLLGVTPKSPAHNELIPDSYV